MLFRSNLAGNGVRFPETEDVAFRIQTPQMQFKRHFLDAQGIGGIDVPDHFHQQRGLSGTLGSCQCTDHATLGQKTDELYWQFRAFVGDQPLQGKIPYLEFSDKKGPGLRKRRTLFGEKR